jgi:predicted SAM-dependent methyltransferase
MREHPLIKPLTRIVFKTRQWRHRQIAPQRIQQYLESQTTRKIQIGAGPTQHEGWLNTTLQPLKAGTVHLNATGTFPIPSEQFDYVFSERMIEHLPFEGGQNFIQESFRILKHGGKIRIATPNLMQIIKLYAEPEGDEQRAYIQWITETFMPYADMPRPSYAINRSFGGWGHLFIYDKETLQMCLERAGFEDVQWFSPGESDDEHFTSIENHGNVVGDDTMMRYETMIAQAVKPQA